MVTAVSSGGALSPLFELAPTLHSGGLFFGATTAFSRGRPVRLVRNTSKRIVAYSTARLGYMFVANGGRGASFRLHVHLFTHAFFKALLVPGSGSVTMRCILAGIRNMGGLKDKIPLPHRDGDRHAGADVGLPLNRRYIFSKNATHLGPRSPRTIRWRSNVFLITVIAAD